MNGIKAAITAETIDLAKAAFLLGPSVPSGPGLQKAGINVAENLVGINLEAPSKKLFPVYSPLRNRFARIQSPVGATAVQWKQIDGINTGNLRPGVAENTRNAFNTTGTTARTATFKTLGHDDYVGFEALSRSKGFEDVRATAALNLLYSVMISEEAMILGGNETDLGAPINLSGAGAVTTGGGLSVSTTHSIGVSALVLFGNRLAEKAAASAGANEADGETTHLAIDVATGGGDNSITATWDALKGAVAYNVFIKVGSGVTPQYLATVFVNAFTFLAVGTGADPNLVDSSGSALDFDGIIPQIEKNAAGNLFKSLDNATLTSDNVGGIVEFDDILEEMWDKFKLGPSAILVNAKQARDVTKKIGSSSNLAYRVYLEDGQKTVTGGIYVASYLNKFASSFAEGFPNEVPLKIHPDLPPGTILFIVETLPYPNNQVPNVWEIETLTEYTQYEWALTQRRYEFGIYHEEVLKGYFPKAQGAIVNIKEG